MVKKCKVRKAEAVYCLEEEKRSEWWYNWNSELAAVVCQKDLRQIKLKTSKCGKGVTDKKRRTANLH